MDAPRKLAAILAADVVGYSRLTGLDEEGTIKRLRKLRRELISPAVALHRGRVVKTTGDGILIEFPSVVDAVRCALDVQRGMDSRNADVPADQLIEFRVGINVGDVVVEGEDLLGDGVNVAARLEGISEPGGICISEAAYLQVRDKLDVSFDDAGEQQLKNIARPVRTYRVRLDCSPAQAKLALPLPDKPSIAVLPFQNLSGDPEQEYFADGMVEEIITALSRIRWLFVIARNSSFTYKGQSPDVRQVGRELGVRYVLEGSVRKGSGRVRITAQLIEAETGAHLWADRFDGSLEDVFDLQDQVATSVAGVIEPALQVAETRRSIARPRPNLSAYDFYLRALPLYASLTKTAVLQALQFVKNAISFDPDYGPALAVAGLCHMRLWMEGWAEEPDIARQEGIQYAQHALHVAADDPTVLANAAYVLARLGEDIDAMMALLDRSLALNPSFARGWYLSGALRMSAGQLDTAIEHINKSFRLSPRDHFFSVPFYMLGATYFAMRRFDEAVAKLLQAIQEHPEYPGSYRFLAACYAHMGRVEAAHEMIERLERLTPVVAASPTLFRVSEHRELLESGLRLAAGEEEI